MTIILRKATAADAAAAGAICHAAFKTIAESHHFPPDFPDVASAVGLMEHMLTRDDIDAVVAERGGKLVGSNFLWRDGQVAGVGPITIDPAEQNSNVGRRLMQAVLERAWQHDIAAVRLVQAAYHGRSLALYNKLGFSVREPLTVFQGQALHLPQPGHLVRAATRDDIGAASALAARLLGIRRSGELTAAIAQGTAQVVERDGHISGYTTGIGFFGHAVGEAMSDLQALIGAASAFAGPGFLVPTRNAALMHWCLERGLRIVQPMSLMTLGPYDEPNGPFLPSILY